MKKRQEILALHRAGISNRKIAERLNVDKGSVNDLVNKVEAEREKYFAAHPNADRSIIIPFEVEEPKYVRKSGQRPRKITPDEDEKLKGFLADNEKKKRTHRSKQLKTVKAMCDDLNAARDKDNKLGYTTVKDRVRQLKAESAKPKEAYIMQEHEPGYEGQFDWCEAGLKIGDDGDFKQYQIGVLVSACSGFVYARIYYKQNTEAFLDMHSKCFEFLGVVYEEMVYDNAKVQVKKIVGMTEKEPTEAMLRVANHYDFAFRFCNVRSPNEKGVVERRLDYLRELAYCDQTEFDSIEEAQIRLDEACYKYNNTPSKDGRTPAQKFEEEKKVMRRAPYRLEVFTRGTYKVDDFSTVNVLDKHYSVPDNLVGKQVDVKYSPYKVYAYYEGELVAEHERNYSLTVDSTLEITHYITTFERKPGSVARSKALKQSDPRLKKIFQDYYTKDVKTFIRVLRLLKEKGLGKIIKVFERLYVISPMDASYDKVLEICDQIEDDKIREQTGKDKYSDAAKDALPRFDELRERQKEIGKEKEADKEECNV
ncbi:MAG: IS21 family transposase [Bacteroidales bacterium]|nr:IS21 family transposase [Bacteroidales bacterium]